MDYSYEEFKTPIYQLYQQLAPSVNLIFEAFSNLSKSIGAARASTEVLKILLKELDIKPKRSFRHCRNKKYRRLMKGTRRHITKTDIESLDKLVGGLDQ